MNDRKFDEALEGTEAFKQTANNILRNHKASSSILG
jgi:hypothetical protein